MRCALCTMHVHERIFIRSASRDRRWDRRNRATPFASRWLKTPHSFAPIAMACTHTVHISLAIDVGACAFACVMRTRISSFVHLSRELHAIEIYLFTFKLIHWWDKNLQSEFRYRYACRVCATVCPRVPTHAGYALCKPSTHWMRNDMQISYLKFYIFFFAYFRKDDLLSTVASFIS